MAAGIGSWSPIGSRHPWVW